MQRKNFFEKFSIFVSFWSLEGCGKGVRGDTSPHCYLTIEYTVIRYVPERGRKSQPNEGAPRPSCPSGL